ncbi:hypothetical protein H0H87_002442 [Tephrocybe sp. NHM501043]|nr:hypothetical protein H0H87_002442 [Tephrocybe sp. NHM501043]
MDPSTPTPRRRIPAINTDLLQDFTGRSLVATPNTPVHDIRISTSPGTDISPISPSTQPLHKINANSRARTESRKLLAHVLDQLERRTLPPNIFDTYDGTENHEPENNLRALLQTVKGAVNSRKVSQEAKRPTPAGIGEDDSDDDEEHEYSTDVTYSLMLQLKDLLSVSVDQDWHILDDKGVLEDLGQIQGINDITSSANGFPKPLHSVGSSTVAIHIEPVEDLTPQSGLEPLQWRSWSASPYGSQKLRSTYAPSQSLAVYLLSSLIAPLLATIVDFVDLEPKSDAGTDVLHRFRRLLRLIVEAKPDAYNDVLQLVGYHTHQARRTALSILCAVWPDAAKLAVLLRYPPNIISFPGASLHSILQLSPLDRILILTAALAPNPSMDSD